jgi:hypothetical protein
LSKTRPFFSEKNVHTVSASARAFHRHRNIVPNNPPKVLSVDQKPRAKQESSQQQISLKTQLMGCIPNNPNGFVFFLFVMIYLVIASIQFANTGNSSMLTTLLPYLAAYVGIPMVTPHIPWGKKEGNDRQS